MTNEECDDHGKKYSKTYNSASGLWKKDPHKMYQKTVLRQGITKWGYLDPHDLMNMGAFDDADGEETDYMKGVEIKEIPPQSVDQNLAALGFGSEEPEQPPVESEVIQEQEPVKEPEQKEVVHVVTSKEWWSAVKAKGLSNTAGQNLLNAQGGDYNAALFELNKK
jgi:recombinational DNA repair protein RecT